MQNMSKALQDASTRARAMVWHVPAPVTLGVGGDGHGGLGWCPLPSCFVLGRGKPPARKMPSFSSKMAHSQRDVLLNPAPIGAGSVAGQTAGAHKERGGDVPVFQGLALEPAVLELCWVCRGRLGAGRPLLAAQSARWACASVSPPAKLVVRRWRQLGRQEMGCGLRGAAAVLGRVQVTAPPRTLPRGAWNHFVFAYWKCQPSCCMSRDTGPLATALSWGDARPGAAVGS